MRILVFLLILSNLLFFAWTHDYLGLSREPDAYRAREQLHADQLRIVSTDQPPPEAERKEKAPKQAERPAGEACLLLADMSPADAESLEAMFAEKLPGSKVVRTTTPGSASYWVNIPPLKSKREADNKVAELKKFGIKEYFVVQENGPNNLAISLGLFSTQEAAAGALESLREKGVRSARVTERSLKPALAQLEVRGTDAQAEEMRQIVAQAASQAKQVACKPRNAAAQ